MPASDELKELYADAFEKGFFVKEVPAEEGYVAFCGNVRKLINAGFKTKEQRKNMSLINCQFYMTPGGGETREEAVRSALELCLSSESWIPTN